MIFRSENYIEGYMVFFEKFFVGDSNQIAVSYCIGSVEFRCSKKFRPLNPFFAVGAKIWIFCFFAIFSKMKNPGKFFFRLRRRALTRAIQRCKFIAICCLIRELWAFK
jgi:hypothetical protein